MVLMEVGSTIAGKYRITGRIGAGGMGEVMAAVHVHLDTPVALKFLSDESPTSLKRFLREAKAAARLKSEHVCRVSDFGLEHNQAYLVMERLEGQDLGAILRRGPLDVATAADYVMQACVGVAEAHAAGIVHRDLKPGNLFLTKSPDGRPLIKVLDFGVAKVHDVDVQLTNQAHIVGSPPYMSPEQIMAGDTIDARSDIWALGVVLYELVSNRRPFQAASQSELLAAITHGDFAPLVEAPALQAIVARCLQKDPLRRFPDVARLAKELAPLVTRISIGAATVAGRILDAADELAPHRVEPPSRLPSTAVTVNGKAPRVIQPPAPPDRSRLKRALALAGLLGLAILSVTYNLSRNAETKRKVPVAPPVDPSLVLSLDFETFSGKTTTSSNGVLATCPSPESCPTAMTAWPGNALRFDGNDEMRVEYDPVIETPTAFTISAWVFYDGRDGAVVSKPLTESYWNTWQLEIADGRATFTTSDGAGVHEKLMGDWLKRDQWTLLAGVWTGTEKQLYVDGHRAMSSPWTAYVTKAQPILIGFDLNSDKAQLHLTGGIDDVRLYNRALSALEIATLQRN